MYTKENLLTEKQEEALELVADHLSSKEIGLRLGISSHSVDKRVDDARRRLGAATRKEAVRLFKDHKRVDQDGDWFTGEPITVSKNGLEGQSDGDERNDALYEFADVGLMPQPAPWRSWTAAVPEIEPERLSIGAKLGFVLAGALGMVVLVLLLLALMQGLQTLI
ncbi:response regulator transcription factor [Allopontixanthobacter sediminis]|uniref:HTH luxR-type domain-containing protein n=1 Tax=Allopontixanthobacter sediminis TaxID=1689985 RepID=A0A845B343_9SPHN|nr:helix-turn-helix transcriptional regulator [Allopontixanthobacter sediminis]MXP44564.1 hypothetical protein [Allopontixanthobacter sediminis]